MAGRLKEPKIITHYNGDLVCILPIGFYFSDERWEQIWQCFENKGEALILEDLKKLFPDEPTLQVQELAQTGETVLNKENE